MKKIFAIFLSIFLLTFTQSITSASEETESLRVKKVASYSSSTFALLENGDVLAWGYNDSFRLGVKVTDKEKWGKPDNKIMPEPVQNLNNVETLEIGKNNLAIKKDGSLWIWSFFVNETSPRVYPQKVHGATNIKTIEGGKGKFIVMNDGKVMEVNIPQKVTKDILEFSDVFREWPYLNNVKYIDDGLAVKNDGSIWVWNTNNDSTPYDFKEIKNLNNVKKIDNGGWARYVALKEDGTVWAWGRNDHGQVGNGKKGDASEPTQVIGLTGIEDIVVSPSHAFAIKEDGTVWGWGYNYFGNLGDGTRENKNQPVKIDSLNKMKSINVSAAISFAIKEDGTAWAWGGNSFGSLGDGTQEDRPLPTRILAKVNNTNNETDSIQVKLNGETLNFEQPAVLLGGKTMVPLRKIFESLGAKVSWDSETKIVTVHKDNTLLELSIGTNIAFVNNKKVVLEESPRVVNGSTLVPLRFVSETLGAKVEWDSINRTVLITTN